MSLLWSRPNRRLFLDKNVGSVAENRLQKYGHNVLRIEDSSLRDDAEDPEVAIFAREQDRIIITCDRAFEQVKPSDIAPSRITKPAPNRVETSISTVSSGLDLFPHPTKLSVAFMKGNSNEGHNGTIKYHTQNYHPFATIAAVDNIETYLRMNSESYLKSRSNTVTPPMGMFNP